MPAMPRGSWRPGVAAPLPRPIMCGGGCQVVCSGSNTHTHSLPFHPTNLPPHAPTPTHSFLKPLYCLTMSTLEVTDLPVPAKDERFPSVNQALNCW